MFLSKTKTYAVTYAIVSNARQIDKLTQYFNHVYEFHRISEFDAYNTIMDDLSKEHGIESNPNQNILIVSITRM